jgi:acetyl esterase/lipase
MRNRLFPGRLPGLGILTLLPCLSLAQTQPPAQPLWPGGAPGAKGTTAADIPSVQAFIPAAGTGNGSAVVICPGGGYSGLAITYEGTAVAEWMRGLGMAAFVLKYRLGPTYRHPIEMGDAQRALRWVRANARTFGVDTARVGILGFSAGGHLASTAATHFDAGNPAAADSVDRHPCRPAFQILLYPVITMDASFTHGGSRSNLLGSNPSQALVDSLSNEKMVTPRTPPCFLAHTRDDNVVPFKNAQVYNDSLKKKGVPVDFRIYATGPHGFGMADGKAGAPNIPALATWTGYAREWLQAGEFFTPSTGTAPAPESRVHRKPAGYLGTWLERLGFRPDGRRNGK